MDDSNTSKNDAGDERQTDAKRHEGDPGQKADKVLSDEIVSEIRRKIIFGTEPNSPPVSTRFKKSQSGNPKGRPTKSAAWTPRIDEQPLQKLTLKEAERRIAVREGDKLMEMPVKQVVIRAQIASAVKGSAYAQKHVLERIERGERQEAIEIAREHELCRAYQEDCWNQIAEAKRSGKAPPNFIPHPDDFVFEPCKRVRVNGPISEEEVQSVNCQAQIRNALLLQSALNERCAPPGSDDDARDRSNAAVVLAMLVNRFLPKRLHIGDLRMTLTLDRHRRTSKRELLKRTREAWRAAGLKARRGARFPTLEQVRTIMEAVRLISDEQRAERTGP